MINEKNEGLHFDVRRVGRGTVCLITARWGGVVVALEKLDPADTFWRELFTNDMAQRLNVSAAEVETALLATAAEALAPRRKGKAASE